MFKRLWDERPDFINKVFLIPGDCLSSNLGLSAVDEEFIVANIDIIIHCATTNELNGPLKQTTFVNVRSTRDIMLLARRMHKLKVNDFVNYTNILYIFKHFLIKLKALNVLIIINGRFSERFFKNFN